MKRQTVHKKNTVSHCQNPHKQQNWTTEICLENKCVYKCYSVLHKVLKTFSSVKSGLFIITHKEIKVVKVVWNGFSDRKLALRKSETTNKLKCSTLWLISVMSYESCSLMAFFKASIIIDHIGSLGFKQTPNLKC